MDTILWWISTFIFAVVINLVSAYLKPKTDEILARFSSERRAQLELQDKNRKFLLSSLRKSEHLQLLYALDELGDRVRSLEAFLFAIFFLIIISIHIYPFEWINFSSKSYNLHEKIMITVFCVLHILSMFVCLKYISRAINKKNVLSLLSS